MNNYLGLHFDISGYIIITIWFIWWVIIKPLEKSKFNILSNILTFLYPNLKGDNIYNPLTRNSIYLLCFGLFLIVYPIVNLLSIYESYSIDQAYSISYIRDMEFGRNILGMRIISLFTGFRVLNFVKINLFINIDNEFMRYRSKWYVFIFQQYLFYLTSMIMFFAMNSLVFNDYIIISLKNFSLLFSLMGYILSWAIAFFLGYIIDDWRIISDYMINSNGLIFEKQFFLIRRFNYIIFTLVITFIGLNVKFLVKFLGKLISTDSIISTNSVIFFVMCHVFVVFVLSFFVLEFIIFKNAETVDLDNLEGVLRIDQAMKTQKAIKFSKNS